MTAKRKVVRRGKSKAQRAMEAKVSKVVELDRLLVRLFELKRKIQELERLIRGSDRPLDALEQKVARIGLEARGVRS